MHIGGQRGRHILATTHVGAWLLVVCWALIIIVLLTQPGVDETGGRRLRLGGSSIGHAAFFSILGFLVAHALARQHLWRHWWWTVVIVAIFGIGGEVVQSGVPGRSPSLVDLGADALGGLAGAVAWTVMARWQSGANLRRAAAIWPPRRRRRRRRATVDHALLAADKRWHAE